ncbi:MAG: CRISPR-associated protein Csx3 [Okeania sp. SIO3C4]|nr:CRISPR-associated protein Csx3 [Okeania sp. SIO3C4]
MTAIQLNLISHQTTDGMPYQHINIEITNADGIIEPADLKGLKIPSNIQWQQGVVIEGRAPIWLYAYLVHECHPAAWVGCYDTRLGAVVVSTHTHAVTVGSVLTLELPNN